MTIVPPGMTPVHALYHVERARDHAEKTRRAADLAALSVQSEAMTAYAAGASVAQIARSAGVTRTTIYRWIAADEQAELRVARAHGYDG